MEQTWETLEQATQALAATADRAAALIRKEADRAREDAVRTRAELDAVKSDIRLVRADIDTVRTTLASSTTDTTRIRRRASVAWASVTAMAIGVLLAVGYTSARLTWSSSHISHLNTEVAQWRTTADRFQIETIRLRNEAETARVARARAEAHLAALASTSNAGPSDPAVFAPAAQPTLMSLITGLLDKTSEAIRPITSDTQERVVTLEK